MTAERWDGLTEKLDAYQRLIAAAEAFRVQELEPLLEEAAEYVRVGAIEWVMIVGAEYEYRINGRGNFSTKKRAT